MIILSIRIIPGVQRYGIIPAGMERMAFQDALDCHVAAFESAMFLHGFNAVVAAGGIEPA